MKDGIPCNHPGCLSHLSHPCEGCGRVGGITITTIEDMFSKFALNLPKNWQVQIHVENGYGGVYLITPEGEDICMDDPDSEKGMVDLMEDALKLAWKKTTGIG